jgi:hypothetical protein
VTAAAAVNGWAVGVTLSAGGAITNAWNATGSGATGTVTFRNVGYNGQIPAGGSTEFGFQGTGDGPPPSPPAKPSSSGGRTIRWHLRVAVGTRARRVKGPTDRTTRHPGPPTPHLACPNSHI